MLAGLTVAALLVAAGSPSLADPNADAQASAEQLPNGGTVEASVQVGDGSPGGETRPAGGPGSSNSGGTTTSEGMVTYYWRDTGVGCWYGEAGGQPVDGDPDANVFEYVRVDRTTAPPSEMVVDVDCFTAEIAPETTPPPPPPPTLDEIMALAREQIPVPAVAANPDWGGATGLETWFWYEGPGEVTASASIRGYTVTATVAPARFYWDPCVSYRPPQGHQTNGARGCPALLASDTPGSRPAADSDGSAAAARFQYETKGTYEIRHQVVWDGSWSFSGHGASAAGDLPTIRATGARPDYVVDEIRGELADAR